jgi:hypothetical protein
MRTRMIAFAPTIRRLSLAAVLTLALVSPGHAQSPTLPGFPPGVFQSRAALDTAAAAAYQGPGDLVSGWTAWWSGL